MKDLLSIIGDGEKLAVRNTQTETEISKLTLELEAKEKELEDLRKANEDAQERLDQGNDDFAEFISDLPEELDADKVRAMIDSRVSQLADMGMLEIVEVKPKRRTRKKKDDASANKPSEDTSEVSQAGAEPAETATVEPSKEEPAAPEKVPEPETPATTCEPESEAIPEIQNAEGPAEEASEETEVQELSEEEPESASTEQDTAEVPNEAEAETENVPAEEVEDGATGDREPEDEDEEDDFLDAAEIDTEQDLAEADVGVGPEEAEEYQELDEYEDLVEEMAGEIASESEDTSEFSEDDISQMAAEDGASDEDGEQDEVAVPEKAEDVEVDVPDFLR